MPAYQVSLPRRKPVRVEAETALEAVVSVLNKLGLRYMDTKFRVSPVEKEEAA